MEVRISESLPSQIPPPLYSATPIATASHREKEFTVFIGLSKPMVEMLRSLSSDPHDEDLRKNTSDYERFGIGSYEDWYRKGRVPFALVENQTGALAALIWFGPKKLGRKSMKYLSAEQLKDEYLPVTTTDSQGWHTIVFRSYPPFRGTGIMTGFVRAMMELYLQLFPDAKFWASVARANVASIALSNKLGYTIDESLSDTETATVTR